MRSTSLKLENDCIWFIIHFWIFCQKKSVPICSDRKLWLFYDHGLGWNFRNFRVNHSYIFQTSWFKLKVETWTILTISSPFWFSLLFNFTIITKFHWFRFSREKTLLRQENVCFPSGMVFFRLKLWIKTFYISDYFCNSIYNWTLRSDFSNFLKFLCLQISVNFHYYGTEFCFLGIFDPFIIVMHCLWVQNWLCFQDSYVAGQVFTKPIFSS